MPRAADLRHVPPAADVPPGGDCRWRCDTAPDPARLSRAIDASAPRDRMAPVTTDTSTIAADVELVAAFWAALYARDWDGTKAFFDGRSEYWDVPTGPEAGALGAEDILARLLLGLEPLAGYHHVVHSVVTGEATPARGGQAERVVMTEHAETWEWHTGESVTLPFVSVQRIRDGAAGRRVIGRWVDYWNMPTLMDASPAWWQERLFTSDLAWLTDLSDRADSSDPTEPVDPA